MNNMSGPRQPEHHAMDWEEESWDDWTSHNPPYDHMTDPEERPGYGGYEWAQQQEPTQEELEMILEQENKRLEAQQAEQQARRAQPRIL